MLKKWGKKPFFCSVSPKALGKAERGIWKKQRVLEHDVSAIDGQGQNVGSVDDLVWHDVLFVEFVQDQVRIEALGIVSQDREFTFFSHCQQPIQEIPNARTPFKFEQYVAVGGGSTH